MQNHYLYRWPRKRHFFGSYDFSFERVKANRLLCVGASGAPGLLRVGPARVFAQPCYDDRESC